jgi:hypothetical protein
MGFLTALKAQRSVPNDYNQPAKESDMHGLRQKETLETQGVAR